MAECGGASSNTCGDPADSEPLDPSAPPAGDEAAPPAGAEGVVPQASVEYYENLLKYKDNEIAKLRTQHKLQEAEMLTLKAKVASLELTVTQYAGGEVEDEPFTTLGPLGVIGGVYPDLGLRLVVHSADIYEVVGPADVVQLLNTCDVSLFGSISPRSPVTLPPEARIAACIPKAATTFAFLYPLADTCRAAQDDRLSRALDASEPVLNLCSIGGFGYFSGAGQLLSVNSLVAGDGLRFGPPQHFPPQVENKLHQMGRLQPVTADHLRRKKERPTAFAWLGPEDPLISTPNGCFAYSCGGREVGAPPSRLYFPVVSDDDVTPEVAEGWAVVAPQPAMGECQVCFEKKPLVILIPCKHRRSCQDCVEGMPTCPWCRKNIERFDICYD